MNAVLGDPCRRLFWRKQVSAIMIHPDLGREDTDNFDMPDGQEGSGIKRSVCLVHNPRNAALFEELGGQAVNLPMILAQVF